MYTRLVWRTWENGQRSKSVNICWNVWIWDLKLHTWSWSLIFTSCFFPIRSYWLNTRIPTTYMSRKPRDLSFSETNNSSNAPQHRTWLVIFWYYSKSFETISSLFGTASVQLATISWLCVTITRLFVTISLPVGTMGLFGGCTDEFKTPQSCM